MDLRKSIRNSLIGLGTLVLFNCEVALTQIVINESKSHNENCPAVRRVLNAPDWRRDVAYAFPIYHYVLESYNKTTCEPRGYSL